MEAFQDKFYIQYSYCHYKLSMQLQIDQIHDFSRERKKETKKKKPHSTAFGYKYVSDHMAATQFV